MIEGQKLIDFFDAEWAEECNANEIKKGIQEDIKAYAENNEIEPKAIKSAYALFKKYRGGKNSQKDIDDYAELSNIIENYFAFEEAKEAKE
jgi:uncharacterized protein YktA (UPF0223 family)